MSLTVTQLKAAIAKEYPTRNWDQQCQRFVWNAIWLTGTRESEIITYPSARAARLAGTQEPRANGESIDHYINRAPLGATHQWNLDPFNKFDHNGVAVGGGLVAYATAKGDTVESWGIHLKVSHVLSYPLGTYWGWALRNGLNAPIALMLPDTVAAGPGLQNPTQTQRQVKSNAFANKRGKPEATPPKIGKADAGSILSMTGWVTGESVMGNAVWFTDGNGWYWSGGFTDTDTHDLANLNV